MLKTRHIPGKLNDIKQFELPKQNTTDRVVNLPDCPQSDILCVLKANFEFICNSIQQQTGPVCVSSSQSQGLGSGCNVSGMEKHIC